MMPSQAKTETSASSKNTASKTSKHKVDRVQNMGLRIILGALRNAPIQEIGNNADL